MNVNIFIHQNIKPNILTQFKVMRLHPLKDFEYLWIIFETNPDTMHTGHVILVFCWGLAELGEIVMPIVDMRKVRVCGAAQPDEVI